MAIHIISYVMVCEAQKKRIEGLKHKLSNLA